jgi:hypothetical protein
MNKNIKTGLVVGILIVIAALSRLVDHPMNFTPMIAIILFCNAMITNKIMKFALPFATILFSDLLIHFTKGYGFHSGSYLVYTSYVIIFILSYYFLRKINFINIFGTTFLSTMVFYLITNFAFFYPESLVINPTLGHYPHNLSGIIGSYQAGLPFLKNMIVGDLFYSTLLFGSYFLVSKFYFSKIFS